MRKNWIQIVSLVLNVVLLASVVYLDGKLEDTRRTLRNDIEDVERGIQSSVDQIEWNVENAIKEATKLVTDFDVEPVGFDADTLSLEVLLRLSLRQWSPVTTVAVETTVGGDRSIQILPIDASGNCSGILLFPIEKNQEIHVAAAITTGGVTSREELASWWDFSAMLPIQLGSWGGSMPEYQDEMLRLESFLVCMDSLNDGYGIPVDDPEFRIYLNDELVKTQPGNEFPDGDIMQYDCVLEGVPCKPGDTMRLAFSCKDAFGLGYEYNLGIWNVPAEAGELEELPLEVEMRPTLTWS